MSQPELLLEPDFEPDHERLFSLLVREVTWSEQMRARKTACFGRAYNYSGVTYDDVPMSPLLVPIAQRLEGALGYLPNNCLLNYYEDGSSTMGFHSDSEAELAPGTGVAIISLGAGRIITFRSKADRSVERSLALPGGSLLYMPPGLQACWKHAILAQEGAAGRISLTFRELL